MSIHANDRVLVLSGPETAGDASSLLLLLLGVTACLQDLFFMAIISVASPSLVGSFVVIIAHRFLGIDGCPHHFCLVARTCVLPLGYALFRLFLSSWRSFFAVGYALLRYTLLTENGFRRCY